MRVLIADALDTACVAALTNTAGLELEIDDTLKDAALTQKIAEFQPEVIIVRSTKVKEEQMDAAENLKLVIRAGAGTNTIACAYAKEKGIAVCNCPGCNSDAVAELTIGLAVAQDRHIADCVNDLRNNQWNKKKYSKARGFKNREWGIIGFGAIGKGVAVRMLAFGMNIHVFDPFCPQEVADEMGVTLHPSPIDVVANSDWISVHVPAIPGKTEGMVNDEFIAAMRDGAVVLNMSRGSIVNDEALLKGLNEKNIYACLDVFNGEPAAKVAEFESPLASHPRVYGTHHIGASTGQATLAVGERVVEIAHAFLENGATPYRVNK
ncbi:hypothetical protein PCE1_000041 [Barthelona sp. PCE]